MSFEEVTGQEAAVSFFRSAYQGGRLAHAYLLLGPPGVGKKSAALAFTKLLVCDHVEGAQPCDHCWHCRKVAAFSHPDVQWITPQAGVVKIDSIREACRRLNLKAFVARRKVFVIAGAQQLNEESSNALLKTLEEPSADSVLVLIAETSADVSATIASRCQKVVFSPLREDILNVLLREKFEVDERAASFLSFFCEGSLGRALEAHRCGVFLRKNDLIRNALDPGCSLEVFDFLTLKDKQLRNERTDEALRLLASWFRDLLLLKSSPGSSSRLVHEDCRQEALVSSRTFDLAQISRRLDVLAEAASEAGFHLNPRVAFSHLRAQLWK